ncbi:MAG: ABC transporter ATP-binding protein [Pseudomonadota bacterium]
MSRAAARPAAPAASAGASSGEQVFEGAFDPQLIGKMWRSMRPERPMFAAALLLYLPLTAAALAQPRLMGAAVDSAIVVGDRHALGRYVLLFAVALAVQHLTQFGQLTVMQIMGQRVIRRLRHQIFSHLQHLDAAFYDRSPVGRLLTRATNDMEAIAELFASGAVTIVGDVVTLVGIVVMLFLWNPQLATMAMLSVPLVLVVTGFVRGPSRRAFRAIRAQTSTLNTYLAEHLGGMSVVQAAVREHPVSRAFASHSRRFLQINNAANIYDATLYALVEAVSTTVVALVIWYGALGVQADALTLGVVVGFIEYLNRFFSPLRDLSSKYTLVQSALAAAERAYGLLDESPVVEDPPAPLDVAPLQRSVEFDRVNFSYRAGSPVLTDIRFTVHRGERVALVGRTGSGKTTIGRLLVRHYDVTSGRILLDGRDLRELRLASLRGRFALVLQDVFLFRGSLRDNLLFGARHLDDEALRRALQVTCAADIIDRRGGLDAVVSERGLNLSLGERQIVALLRTLITEPDILILDEATASIDTATEHCLQDAIDVALRDRTAIVIAHRLSTIQSCDRILVMHDGHLVEQGSHDELMRQGTLYPRLYRLQYQQQEEQRGTAGGATGVVPAEEEA